MDDLSKSHRLVAYIRLDGHGSRRMIRSPGGPFPLPSRAHETRANDANGKDTDSLFNYSAMWKGERERSVNLAASLATCHSRRTRPMERTDCSHFLLFNRPPIANESSYSWTSISTAGRALHTRLLIIQVVNQQLAICLLCAPVMVTLSHGHHHGCSMSCGISQKVQPLMQRKYRLLFPSCFTPHTVETPSMST